YSVTVVIAGNRSVGGHAPRDYIPRLCSALQNVPEPFRCAIYRQVTYAVAIVIAGLRQIAASSPLRCRSRAVNAAATVPDTCIRWEHCEVSCSIAVEVGSDRALGRSPRKTDISCRSWGVRTAVTVKGYTEWARAV